MRSRKQLALVIDQILTSTESAVKDDVCENTIDEYNKLNEKCDQIIIKIKTRKSKKDTKQKVEG